MTLGIHCLSLGYHAVRTERWRYIRYRDGTEELYDHLSDRPEHHNLAGDPQLRALKADLAQYFPASSAPPVPDLSGYDFDFATHTWQRK